MKYLLNIYVTDETMKAWADDPTDLERGHTEVQTETRASGEFIASHELSDDDARVVRVTDDGPLITDGPYAEAKEWVGGYYLLECASRERAIELAAKLGEARYAPIDVRAIVEAERPPA